MTPRSIPDYVITSNAAKEIGRRGLDEETIRLVLSEPEQYEEIRPGRVVVQSRNRMGKPTKSYLVRVSVDLEPHVAEVVTAYRTSKIAKYWKGEL